MHNIQQAKLPIINSTSFYLQHIISQNKDKNHGKLNPTQLETQIHDEGRRSLFMPSSNFKNWKKLMDRYGDSYLSDLNEINWYDARGVAIAYMEELEIAKAEGRYFGRNRDEIMDRFGTKREGIRELKKFLGDHGYRVLQREPDWDESKLLDYYKIQDFVLHESDIPRVSGERMVPRA